MITEHSRRLDAHDDSITRIEERCFAVRSQHKKMLERD